MRTTRAVKISSVVRSWHLVDAHDRILGKVSVEISRLLSGKGKVDYTPNIDLGDYVVVVNAVGVALSGKKDDSKIYYRYSGFPSGLRSETLKSLRQRKPEEVIRRAVSGMLPRNRLHDRRLARLFIYKGSEHPHGAQMGSKNAEI